MANLGTLLKDEIARLSKRVIKSQITPLKKDTARLKREVAALKKSNAQLERHVARLVAEHDTRRTSQLKQAAAQGVESARITAGWVRRVRSKLGVSRDAFGKLVGVTGHAIYLWESGRMKPRAAQQASLIEVRELGKREARRRLEAVAARPAAAKKVRRARRGAKASSSAKASRRPQGRPTKRRTLPAKLAA